MHTITTLLPTSKPKMFKFVWQVAECGEAHTALTWSQNGRSFCKPYQMQLSSTAHQSSIHHIYGLKPGMCVPYCLETH